MKAISPHEPDEELLSVADAFSDAQNSEARWQAFSAQQGVCIVLRPELRERLEKEAQADSKSLDELVNEALEEYVHARQRAKLDKEIAAYEAMHPELKEKYLGQWVAVHERKLVDHDEDLSALYWRIEDRYGSTAVLIRQVKEQPIEEVWIRTPSTGKIIR